MKILLKYVFTTLFRSRIRLALILFTLCLSGAAMLSSLALSDTMIKTTVRQWRNEYGYSEIVIRPVLSSPSGFLNPAAAGFYDGFYSYTVQKLSSGAKVSGDDFIIHGYTLDTLLLMQELPIAEQENLFPFAGNKIILSAAYAKEHGIRPGDTVTAVIGGNRHPFTVAALCASTGPFAQEKTVFAAIIPLEKMQSCLGKLGKADTLYIALRDPTAKSRIILRLSQLYRGYSVGETYSTDHIRLQTNRSAVPFVFMSALLCLTAVYVIDIIFQNIIVERMPQMGIFRAVGAQKAAANAVVLLEGAVYGAAGGALGLGAGVVLLSFMARSLQAENAGAVALSVSGGQIAWTLLTCVGISLVGGILSLRRYRRSSIIGLIRQNLAETESRRAPLRGGAAALFLFCMAVLIFWQSQNGLVPDVLLVCGVMLSFLLASFRLYRMFARILRAILNRVHGILRVVSLSIQNQRGFTVASTVLAVITATNILIGTIAFSSEEGNTRYFGRFHYDIEISAGNLTRGKINLIGQLPGVRDVCASCYSGSVEVEGQSISVYRIHGVDPRKAEAFMDYTFSGANDRPFEELDKGKNILLTETLRNLYGAAENDTIVLKIYAQDGSYREAPYRVIGFFDDAYTKLGRYALISLQNFREDFKYTAYSSCYVSADDAEKALYEIKAAWRGIPCQITTVAEMQRESLEESRMIISAMRWISDLSAVTGVLGMLFIMLLSFRSRQGELAIYGAVGMDKSGIAWMLFLEMLLAGLGGLAAGMILGSLISFLALPRLIYALQIALCIYASPAVFQNACLMSAGICAAAGLFGTVFYRGASISGGLRNEG